MPAEGRSAAALGRWRWMVAGVATVAIGVSAVFAVVAVGGGGPQRELAASPTKVVERAAPDTTPTTASAVASQPAVVAPIPLPNNWMVLGDSVADSFADALQLTAASHGVHVTSWTRPGCGMTTAIPVNPDGTPIPWGASCARNTSSYIDSALRRSGARVIIWHSSWEGADQLYNGQMLALGTPEGDAALTLAIETSIARITRFGARVVLVTNAPRTPFNDIGLAAPPDLVRRVERLNQILSQIADAHAESVELVDLEQIVCPTHPPCPAILEGIKPRPRDGSHFEGYGPGWLAPRLYAAIVAALTHGPPSTAS